MSVNKSIRLNESVLKQLKVNLLRIYDILKDTEMKKYHLIKNNIKIEEMLNAIKNNNLNDKIINIIDCAITDSNAVSTAINWYVNYCPFFSTPLGVIKYSEEWKQQGESEVNHTYKTIRSIIILTLRSHLGMNIDLNVKENDENPLDYDFMFNSTGKLISVNVTLNENAWENVKYVTTYPIKKYNDKLVMYGENKDAVLYAIEFISYFVRNPQRFIILEPNSILKLHGNKWQPKMIKTINEILDLSGYKPYNLIDTCGGALGLSMNITANDYYINDYDSNKIVLYETLQKHHFELVDFMYEKYLSNQYDEQDFDKANSIVNESSENVSAFELSADMIFLYYMRDGRQMKSFIYNKNRDKNDTFQLSKFFSNHHRMLQHASIYNKDIIDFLKSDKITEVLNHKRRKSLLVVDPPYYDTTGYDVNADKKSKGEKNVTLDLEEHQQIIEFLVGGNTPFLYFCRDYEKINSYLIICEKKYDCKLVYTDIQIRKEFTTENGIHHKAIIERIVTNLNVNGFESISKLAKKGSEKS